MKTIIDSNKVHRRALIAQTSSLGGLLVLLASVVAPLFYSRITPVTNITTWVGVGVAMIGIYLANRWAKKPRPEDSLDKALKPLSDSHRLYHYPHFPCDHILLTPAGVVLIEASNLDSYFTYQGGRWREKMTIGRAIRYIVEEHLGDPIRNAQDEADALKARITRELGEDVATAIPVRAVVVFTHPNVHLETEGTPIPVCKVDRLRKHLPPTLPKLSPEIYAEMEGFLDRLTI